MPLRKKKKKNQNIKKKQYCNKFNKDLKNGPHQKKNLKKKKELSVKWRHEELNLGEKGRMQNYAIISQ